MFDPHRNWWAQSSRNARRTMLGASVLVIGLVAASTAVWASPESSPAPTPTATSSDQALADSSAKNKLLASKIAGLEKDLADAKAKAKAKSKATPTPAPKAPAAPPVTDDDPPSDDPDPSPLVIYRDVDSSDESQPAPPAPDPTPEPAPAVTAPARDTLVSPDQRYFGMYTAQAPFNFATFDDTSTKVGVQPGIVGYFGGWDQTFRADVIKKSWARGMLPLLTWESRPINAPNSEAVNPEYSLPRIIGDPEAGVPGAFDDYLHQYARDIVASGLPLAIRLDHEMNGSWYPWGEETYGGKPLNGNRPGDYVRMWQHVHDIFEAEGANDLVIWVWAPNIINNLNTKAQSAEFLARHYPGDEYVDWVGLSGYLRAPFRAENTFSFDYIFGKSLTQLRALTKKPIFLAEVGATEVGNHKPAYVADFMQAFTRPQNADVIGFAWFNLTVTTVSGGDRVTNDWRIESRADSLAAFTNGITNPAAGFALTPYPK
ncbi:MAG: glycosyl hydrolase [Leifsonia sp.]